MCNVEMHREHAGLSTWIVDEMHLLSASTGARSMRRMYKNDTRMLIRRLGCNCRWFEVYRFQAGVQLLPCEGSSGQ